MTAEALGRFGDSAHKPHGWLASMLVHGVAVLVALIAFSELKPASQPEPFRWEIALAQVVPPAPVDTPKPAPPQPKPVVQPPPPAPPKPVEAKPVVQQVQTVQTVERIQHVVRQEQMTVQNRVNPVVETIAQHAEPIQHVEAVQQTEVVEATPVTPVSTPMSQPSPVTQQVVQAEATPVVSEVVAARPAPVTTSEPVVTQAAPAPIQQAVVSQPAAEAVQAPAPVQQTAHAAPAQPQAVERPAAVTAQTKADYSWLTQELLSRLERSKRYPYTARMNRWEGRVVVKAVVRDDGQVVSLQIAESSGHAVLDNDAMELIRQVSPIQLKYPLGKTQVALLVPVGYSLH